MSAERVSLRFESFRSFLDECSPRISEEGIFLATETISPVGSRVEFDLGLDDDFPILRGSGEVVWIVESNGEESPPGMAIRYDVTDDATSTLVRRIAQLRRSTSGEVFDLAHDSAAGGADEKESTAFATQAVTTALADADDDADDGVEETTSPEATLGTAEDSDSPESDAPAPVLSMPPYLEEAVSEAEGSPKKGRGGLWALLALFAVLAGAAYWQRDFLADKLGGGSTPAPEAREIDPAAPAEPVVTTDVVEPEIQTAVEPTPPEPAAVTGPLSRIQEVRWRATEEGTVLQLLADGAFPEAPGEGYDIERLEDPPRLLLRISGVTAPLARPTLAVGSEEVVGIRTALHGSPPSSSLHLVVDLADPTAQVTAAEVDGPRLQLRISSAAISP